jgi:integrase
MDPDRRGIGSDRNKLLILLHGILGRARKVYGLIANAAADVEKFPQRRSGDIEVFSPDDVWALVRAAACEQDGALFLTAAFTGLRMGELLALRWRDVDFVGAAVRVRASYAGDQLTTPKSGKARSVPLAPDVAQAIAQLGRRDHRTGDDDLVFSGEAGGYLDGSACAAATRRRLSAPVCARFASIICATRLARG